MMKRYKPYTFEIDFELDDMFTVEAQAVVQLPDSDCLDSDVDYYGFRQITDVHVYHNGEEVDFHQLPNDMRHSIYKRAARELESYLDAATTAAAFAEEVGGF